MEILGYVTYGIGVLLTLIWLAGIRANTNSGEGVAATTVNITLLFIASLILVPAMGLSPFNIIWLFIASVVVGMLSGGLLSLPSRILWQLVCVGIDTSNLTKRGIYGASRAGLDVIIDESLSSEDDK